MTTSPRTMSPHTASARSASARPYRIALASATALSAIAAILGLIWLVDPTVIVFGVDTVPPLVIALVGMGPATLVLTLTSVVGVAAGAAALTGSAHGRRSGAGLVAAVGGLETLVFGVGFGSLSTLSTVGYLVAMTMPVLLLIVIVQVIRRYPIARWTIGVPVLLAAGIGLILGREPLGVLVSNLGPALARQAGFLLITLLMIAIGFAWAAAAVLAVVDTDAAKRMTSWVTRHRTLFTLIAAFGPVPYGLARLTWLTPWPIFGAEAAADMPTRILGLALSSGSWFALVLTIGLIRPWGEVFGRWIPVLRGRRVPVAAAAVPGGIVAAMLCFAAVPFLMQAALGGSIELMLIFPCWFWGPALALAVWGYAGHRRGEGGSHLNR